MKKQGFTLVELSIVLIIIGLLIGGILAAQSMIKTSKVTATIAQIGQFDAGTGSFYSKYNYLPGDAPAMGGDGDGLITRTTQAWTIKDVNLIQCEMASYWNHIAPDTYSLLPCGGVSYYYRNQMTSSFPKTKIGIKDGFFIASALASSTWPNWQPDYNVAKNYYVMVSPYNYPSCYNCDDYGQGANSVFHSVTAGNRTLSPADTLALDSKMDDSLPESGKVIAGSFASGNSGATATALATCSSGTNYLISNTGYECTPLIEIGTLSGLNK